MDSTTVAITAIHITSFLDASRVLFTFYPTAKQQSMGMTMRHALEAAILHDADLYGANLCNANLRGADLCGANLCDADLRGADLRGADLDGTDLRGADLRDANLCGTDLRHTNLRGANLRGVALTGANLANIKADYFDVLLRAPGEVAGLRAALIAGRVDGSTYEGECACLVGTIANVRGAPVNELDGIKPDSGRPIECFFTAIRKGDTPEKNQCSALAVQWIDEFTALLAAAHDAADFKTNWRTL